MKNELVYVDPVTLYVLAPFGTCYHLRRSVRLQIQALKDRF